MTQLTGHTRFYFISQCIRPPYFVFFVLFSSACLHLILTAGRHLEHFRFKTRVSILDLSLKCKMPATTNIARVSTHPIAHAHPPTHRWGGELHLHCKSLMWTLLPWCQPDFQPQSRILRVHLLYTILKSINKWKICVVRHDIKELLNIYGNIHILQTFLFYKWQTGARRDAIKKYATLSVLIWYFALIYILLQNDLYFKFSMCRGARAHDKCVTLRHSFTLSIRLSHMKKKKKKH